MQELARLVVFGLVTVVSLAARASAPPQPYDPTPRIAIVSAYQPEWATMRAALSSPKQVVLGRTTFLVGDLEHRAVVLFLSGISMVNAASTTQLAIDHFNVSAVVFSGIAGGVDPALSIGDVVVPDRWSQYLESAFARQTNQAYVLPPFEPKTLPNYGMIFPQPVQVARPGGEPEKIEWFAADAHLLSVARRIAASVHLDRCDVKHQCLDHQPKIVVGGNGVSGQAFVDNAAFRDYVFHTFSARVLDMESAAVAQVTYMNDTPFVAFRSLSDLAGGDAGQNQEAASENLASTNSATVVMALLRALP